MRVLASNNLPCFRLRSQAVSAMARQSEPYGSLMRQGRLNEEAVHSLFTNFDADGDGVISSKELAGLLLGLALTSENAADSETDMAYWMKVGHSMTAGLLWETLPSVLSQCLHFDSQNTAVSNRVQGLLNNGGHGLVVCSAWNHVADQSMTFVGDDLLSEVGYLLRWASWHLTVLPRRKDEHTGAKQRNRRIAMGASQPTQGRHTSADWCRSLTKAEMTL